MALETLKGVKKLGGFTVVDMDNLRSERPDMFEEHGAMKWKLFEKDIRPHNFIYLRHDKNSLSFTLQNGPIKEVGVNGCQVDTLIHAAKHIISELNKKFPCRENALALTKLEESLHWLDARTKNREERGAEGYSKP